VCSSREQRMLSDLGETPEGLPDTSGHTRSGEMSGEGGSR